MKKGFTLAEVLITLTIIGIIAALVIPAILQDVQDSSLKAAFKKIYSELDQTTRKLVLDNNGSLAYVITGANWYAENDSYRDLYLQHLSYVRKCDVLDVEEGSDANGDYIQSNCWVRYTKELRNGATIRLAYGSQAVLNNGASLSFWVSQASCKSDELELNIGDRVVCGWITIDVNGPKEPNVIGRDIFQVYTARDRMVPCGGDNDVYHGSELGYYCTPSWSDGTGCAAMVLLNKDY